MISDPELPYYGKRVILLNNLANHLSPNELQELIGMLQQKVKKEKSGKQLSPDTVSMKSKKAKKESKSLTLIATAGRCSSEQKQINLVMKNVWKEMKTVAREVGKQLKKMVKKWLTEPGTTSSDSIDFWYKMALQRLGDLMKPSRSEFVNWLQNKL